MALMRMLRFSWVHKLNALNEDRSYARLHLKGRIRSTSWIMRARKRPPKLETSNGVNENAVLFQVHNMSTFDEVARQVREW